MDRRRTRAGIYDDPDGFFRGDVRLLVENDGLVLMADGSWSPLPPEGVAFGIDAGIRIPRAAIEAIATAIREWQGHASHADTEARVLREWLAVEQRRVDAALGAKS